VQQRNETVKMAAMEKGASFDKADTKPSLGPGLDEIVGQSDAKSRLEALVELHVRAGTPTLRDGRTMPRERCEVPVVTPARFAHP
jgi:hypothetical protein